MSDPAQSTTAIGLSGGELVDGGRNADGIPVYWRWDPTRVNAVLGKKLDERAAHGYTNPPLIPLPERISALDELAAIDEALASTGGAQVWPPNAEVVALREYRRDLDANTAGTARPSMSRRLAHTAAAAFNARTTVTAGGMGPFRSAPPVVAIGAIVAILGMLVLPGNPVAALVAAAAITLIGVCTAPAVQRWADADPLAFTPDDHHAISAAYVEVTVHATDAAEYDLARRATTACDAIAGNRAFRDSTYLAEHRAFLDPAVELRDMVTHAHQIAAIRAQLGSDPEGDDADAVLAREVFHRHDQVIAASVDHLRGRVVVIESYARHLAELSRQLDNQDALRRSDSAASAVDALHRYDASDFLAAENVGTLDSDLSACTAAITAHLDALRGDLAGLDRMLTRTDDDS